MLELSSVVLHLVSVEGNLSTVGLSNGSVKSFKKIDIYKAIVPLVQLEYVDDWECYEQAVCELNCDKGFYKMKIREMKNLEAELIGLKNDEQSNKRKELDKLQVCAANLLEAVNTGEKVANTMKSNLEDIKSGELKAFKVLIECGIVVVVHHKHPRFDGYGGRIIKHYKKSEIVGLEEQDMETFLNEV